MGMNSSYSALCCDTVINITPAEHYTTYLYFALWQICGMIFQFTGESGYRRYTSFVLRQDIDANSFVGAKHNHFWRQHFFNCKIKIDVLPPDTQFSLRAKLPR
jgi:hypothetical protein